MRIQGTGEVWHQSSYLRGLQSRTTDDHGQDRRFFQTDVRAESLGPPSFHEQSADAAHQRRPHPRGLPAADQRRTPVDGLRDRPGNEDQGLRGNGRRGLRLRDPRRRALPRQLPQPEVRHRRRVPAHPEQGAHLRRPRVCRRCSSGFRCSKKGWCSSRGRPVPANRPRSPR